MDKIREEFEEWYRRNYYDFKDTDSITQFVKDMKDSYFGGYKSRDEEIKKLKLENRLKYEEIKNQRECLETLLSECANDLSGQACLFIEKALKDIT